MNIANDVVFNEEFMQKAANVRAFMEHNTSFPVVAIALYLTFVFIGPQMMESRPAAKVKTLLIVWNAFLSVFSICGFINTMPHMLHAISEHGIKFTLCTPADTWYNYGHVGFWVMLFILSKFPEMIDTCFLVIEKKPVIFLHWFHHATVAMYCWHSYMNNISAGLHYSTMNYTVHSIMYTYYFLMCTPLRRFVRPIAPLITGLQIMQMFFGILLSAAQWYMTTDDTCYINKSNLLFSSAIYLSYFLLFIKFYVDIYIKKRPKTK